MAGHLSICLSDLYVKMLKLDIIHKLLNQIPLLPVLSLHAINLFHFMLLLAMLAKAGGQKVGTMQNLFDSFSNTVLIWSG